MPIRERKIKLGNGDSKTVWDVRVQYYGKRISRRVQTTFTEAKRVEGRLLNALMNGRYELLKKKEDPTFRTYAEKYKEWVTWHKSYDRTVISINHLKDYFGSKHLSDISGYDFLEYRQKRLKKITKSTVNREHTCLLRMLNVAVNDDRYQIYKNPLQGIKKYKEPPAENRILTIDEYHKLLDAAPDYFRRIIFFACNTGMRKMEILNLKFGQIRIWHSGGEVELLETKSGDKEYVPLNSDLVELVKESAKERNIDLFQISSSERDLHVFNGKWGKPISSIRKPLSKTFENAKVEERPFHTFRHFWTKMMFEAGIDPATIQTVGRWKDFETMLKYCYTTRTQEHDAVNKLTEKLKKRPAKPHKLRLQGGNN